MSQILQTRPSIQRPSPRPMPRPTPGARYRRVFTALALAASTLVAASPAQANILEALFGKKEAPQEAVQTDAKGHKLLNKKKQVEQPAPRRREANLPVVRAKVAKQMAAHGFTMGSQIYLRGFKTHPKYPNGVLEMWVKRDGRFQLFRNFPMLKYSGTLGGKRAEGDYQAPEGFYNIGSAEQFNPYSREYLSINTGFPNARDRAQGHYGTHLMIHGGALSIGCYAIGDDAMEFVYAAAEAAWNNGQRNIPMHLMPMPMTAENMTRLGKFKTAKTWKRLWSDLKAGYDAFEATRQPPMVTIAKGEYVVPGYTPAVMVAENENTPSKDFVPDKPLAYVDPTQPLPRGKKIPTPEARPVITKTVIDLAFEAAKQNDWSRKNPVAAKTLQAALETRAIAMRRCLSTGVSMENDAAMQRCASAMREAFKNAGKAKPGQIYVRPEDGEVRHVAAAGQKRQDSMHGFIPLRLMR